MKKLVNGIVMEMTEEEFNKVIKESAISSAQSKYTQLTTEEVLKMLFKANPIQVDNETALRMKSYYPTFEELVKDGKKLAVGTKLTYKDELWETIQSFVPMEVYPPSLDTASLYKRINETYAGTMEEPILYRSPMILENTKYYTDGIQLYLCNRDSENPVTHELKELIGLYVEIV